MRGAGALLVLAVLSVAPARAADVTISIDPATIAAMPVGAPTIGVEVTDARDTVTSERQSLGVSLGKVMFDPAEADLVKAVVAAKAAAYLQGNPTATVPDVIHCSIRRFVVETPSTALYWDVKASIELVLRVADKDRVITGESRERTYVYPTRKLIDKATRQALAKVADGVEPALRELSAPAPR